MKSKARTSRDNANNFFILEMEVSDILVHTTHQGAVMNQFFVFVSFSSHKEDDDEERCYFLANISILTVVILKTTSQEICTGKDMITFFSVRLF